MNAVTLFAPAKINLVLEVGGIRDDGFHEVAGVMTTIPLYDIVVVSPASSTTVKMHGLDIPMEENLAFRAAKAFCRITGMENGAHIRIFKAIPDGAGLGGGSSDAVAVLKAMDFLNGGGTPRAIMYEIAAQLGSDCPFFLNARTSHFTGRGTRIQAVTGAELPPMVVLIPAQGNVLGLGPLSTTAVYREFDRIIAMDQTRSKRKNQPFGSLTERIIYNLTSRSEEVNIARLYEPGFNALEPAIVSIMPDALILKDMMLDAGAKKVWFSGAGASVVGLFNRRTDAMDAIAGLGTRLRAGILTLWLT